MTPSTGSVLTVTRRSVLQRRIRWVVAGTIAYNVIEAVVALAAGTVASSSALIGFGLDSIVEVLSAAAVAWQFSGADPQRRERPALRVIAVSFFGLAAFVTIDAVRVLLGAAEPEHSPVGIGLAAVSLVVMPVLSWVERRTGRELGSASAVADSKQTLICAYLSAVLLVGLLLNSLFGWTWADPLAALVIAGFAVREGLEAWRGEACCTPVSLLTGEADEDDCTAGGPCTAEHEASGRDAEHDASRRDAPYGPTGRDAVHGASRGDAEPDAVEADTAPEHVAVAERLGADRAGVRARRAQQVAQARELDLLNAVFALHYFNRRFSRNSGECGLGRIDLLEALGDLYSPGQIAQAITRTDALIEDGRGASTDPRDVQANMARLRTDHPGFRDRALGDALDWRSHDHS